ncbi:MAG TPA: DUF881 domain-containing protein [Nocardioides sp.]|nr:DUF881 domain-containing protein [Nocardioides sp.]
MTDSPEGGPRRKRGIWRIGTPLVVLVSGALFAVSADNSEGTDLRPGRYTDLASLVDTEADEYDELEDRVADLKQEVDSLTDEVDDEDVRRLQQRIDELRDPAGLEPRQGEGITVVLSDAPAELIEQAVEDDLNPNLLVVHQQDIQAVVNAMWAGGATAVTIEGQRVITTTGIKCEGNAVQLQGVPYPQPYEIQAVGDPDAIEDALDADSRVGAYRSDAADPALQVGWALEVEDSVEAPAYTGLLNLSYAEPLR